MSDKAAEISVLHFPDNVRKRKEMYLNDLNHCVQEIVDNSVDEHSAGFCSEILVVLHENSMISVSDNGRGIPIGPHSDPMYKGLSQAEVAFTVLHAGGKFGEKSGYQTATGGLHGVGASCVNAVSSSMLLTIFTDGKQYDAKFEKGLIKTRLHEVKDAVVSQTGTTVSFIPDKEIWGDEQLDVKHLEKRLRQLAYLNPGLTIRLINQSEKEMVFKFPHGIKSYVEQLIKAKTPITDIVCYSETTESGSIIDIAYVWTDGYTQDVYTFANNVATEAGGDHLNGFRQGIAKAIEVVSLECGAIKNVNEIEADDCREGLTAIVSVKVREPKFEGQGKSRFINSEIRSAVYNSVKKYVDTWLRLDDRVSQAVIGKMLQAAKARLAAKKARENVRGIKDVFDSGSLAGKLWDCQSKNPAETEVYIVEGDSAGGTCKAARDRRTQAILPIFGKILNVEKSRLEVVLKNGKLLDLVKALRCGIGESFDISKLKYHKIILLSDADVDGDHIKCLYLVFFWRYLREIVEAGYLYAGMPPLYKVTKGKTVTYLYSDAELRAFDMQGATAGYIKGLGEMSAEELWDTTMDPKNRKLIQITMLDVEEAEAYITTCMGDNVEIRKQFIMDNAS